MYIYIDGEYTHIHGCTVHVYTQTHTCTHAHTCTCIYTGGEGEGGGLLPWIWSELGNVLGDRVEYTFTP